MKKLNRIKNCCAVVALFYVSGKKEDTVLNVCRFYGFHPDEGMDDEDWRDAAVHLGLKVRQVNFKDMRLKKFIKLHPAGIYLIATWNHLFVLDNGIVIDPRGSIPPNGLNRIIKQAWTVKKM